MSITTAQVQILLENLMNEKELIHPKWKDSKHSLLKQSGATTKGDIAEDLLIAILNELKVSTYRREGRRDHYDVLISNHNYSTKQFVKIAGGNGSRTDREKSRDARNLLKNHPDIKAIEVKCATEDVSGSFQFNGLRTDSVYTHCFLLGIAPNDLYFRFVQKELLNTPLYPLVSMQRGANAAFKLTRKVGTIDNGGLLSFDCFTDVLNNVLNLGEHT